MTQTLPDSLTGHRLITVLAERMASGSRPGKRTDGYRVALAVEGGGMRGSVSAGMAFRLHELGLLRTFDAVYGSSAGTITAAWLLSSGPQGLLGWAEPHFARTMIRKRNLLRGRPLVDVERLIEEVYVHQFPMDYASILDGEIEFHPLATDILTGKVTDLHSELKDTTTLRLAIRASAALPVLAGPPISLGGRRYFDSGLSESVPFRQALRDGATHVLVLRSKPLPESAAKLKEKPKITARIVARTAMGMRSAQLKASYLHRRAQMVDDERVLSAYERDADTPSTSAVLSIRPDGSGPSISKLATDGALLKEAFELGCQTFETWYTTTLGTPPSAEAAA